MPVLWQSFWLQAADTVPATATTVALGTVTTQATSVRTTFATAAGVVVGKVTVTAAPTVRTVKATATSVSLGTVTTAATPTVRKTFATATTVTAGTVTTHATSLRTTFASASSISLGTLTLVSPATVDTVFGIASVAGGDVTASATGFPGGISPPDVGTTGVLGTLLSMPGMLMCGALPPPPKTVVSGHSGGGSRYPIQGFTPLWTAHIPRPTRKRKQPVTVVSGKGRIAVGPVAMVATGIRSVEGRAQARASEPMVTVVGVRTTFASVSSRASGPDLVANGVRTVAALSEILARTVLVASAGELDGHTWTLEERNRHAVLYSVEPALTAMAYRRRT
jgi:hypothetical protein